MPIRKQKPEKAEGTPRCPFDSYDLAVLRLVAFGLTNQEIASELSKALRTLVTPHQVKHQLSNIEAKLESFQDSEANAENTELEDGNAAPDADIENADPDQRREDCVRIAIIHGWMESPPLTNVALFRADVPSDRLWDVMFKIRDGLRRAEMAAALKISMNTLKTHLGHLHTHYDIKNAAQRVAVILALPKAFEVETLEEVRAKLGPRPRPH